MNPPQFPFRTFFLIAFYNNALTYIITILACCFLSLVICLILHHHFHAQLRELAKISSELANGQLSDHSQIKLKGKSGVIQNDLEWIASNLQKLVTNATSRADNDTYEKGRLNGCFGIIQNAVTSASKTYTTNREINTYATLLESSINQLYDFMLGLTQDGNNRINEIKYIMDDVGICAYQTECDGKNALTVGKLATDSKNNINACNNEMFSLLSSVDGIRESSANISKIINIIEDIASQTNILALNASVEAARAGRHGKGFAVVAEEVRNLANKTQTAAQETTSLIEDSINRVEGCTETAQKTASSLNRIVEGINKIYELMMEINSSTDIQAQAFARVNARISQMSEATQSNIQSYKRQTDISLEMAEQFKSIRNVL